MAGQLRAVALAPWNAEEVLEVSVVPMEFWEGTKEQERRQVAKIPQRSSLGDSKECLQINPQTTMGKWHLATELLHHLTRG